MSAGHSVARSWEFSLSVGKIGIFQRKRENGNFQRNVGISGDFNTKKNGFLFKRLDKLLAHLFKLKKAKYRTRTFIAACMIEAPIDLQVSVLI